MRGRDIVAILSGNILIALVLAAIFFLYLPPVLLAGLSVAAIGIALVEGLAFLKASGSSTAAVLAAFNLGFFLKMILIFVAWHWWIPSAVDRPAMLLLLLNFSGHYAWNVRIFHVVSRRGKL